MVLLYIYYICATEDDDCWLYLDDDKDTEKPCDVLNLLYCNSSQLSGIKGLCNTCSLLRVSFLARCAKFERQDTLCRVLVWLLSLVCPFVKIEGVVEGLLVGACLNNWLFYVPSCQPWYYCCFWNSEGIDWFPSMHLADHWCIPDCAQKCCCVDWSDLP